MTLEVFRANFDGASKWPVNAWIPFLATGRRTREKISNCLRMGPSCPGDRRASDGQTLEGSQVPEDVVFEGTVECS